MRLNIIFDNIVYKLQRTGGISTYWQEITARISKHSDFNVCYISGSRLTRYLPIFTKADIIHSSYHRITLGSKTKNVVTVHDFLYELGILKTSGSSINILHKKVAIYAADAIICVSENTKKDLLSFYPRLKCGSNIYVIGHGSLFSIKNPTVINASKRLISFSKTRMNRYILFIGGRISYKNFNSALLGFAGSTLPKMDYSMVCTGAKFSDAEENFITSLGLQHKVLVLDNATNEELKYLYQNAFALVYPSSYEGFGLPPLEAMSCGCPVIASNTSSIPEVVGNSGILVDPQNISHISTALESLLDNDVRNSYIAQGIARAKLFSWDKAAQEYIQIYRSLMKYQS